MTYVIKDNQFICPASLAVADSEENPVPHNNGNKLLGEQHQQAKANYREVEVVHLKQKVEQICRSVSHQLPSSKDYKVVGHKYGSGSLQGRYWGLARHKSKVLWFVCFHGLESLLEYRP